MSCYGWRCKGAMVTCCVLALPAVGAEGPDKPDEQNVPQAPLQEVIVSGYRHSIDASLNVKRAADATVDVITPEDIGKFPDKNVADALQQIGRASCRERV